MLGVEVANMPITSFGINYLVPLFFIWMVFKLMIPTGSSRIVTISKSDNSGETYTQDKVKEKPEKILNPGISSEEFDMRGSE